MTTGDQRADQTWNRAAHRLAARVNRRARLAVLAHHVGCALFVAAALALAWRVFGPAVPGLGARAGVLLLVALGLAIGLGLGWRARRRVRAVGAGDAAWALDRLAEAGGRGLTAALARGPAASEAAWAEPVLPPPPAVRLLPPGGLVVSVAALLLVTLALLASETDAETVPDDGGGGAARLVAGGPGEGSGAGDPAARARAADARAEALDAQANETRRVRAALNLPPEGPLDFLEVAARMRDPERRRAAAAAATPGTALSELLGGEGPDAEALARLLQQSESDRAEASRRRREAAGARAQAALLPVPPGRRAVVQQYLELID